MQRSEIELLKRQVDTAVKLQAEKPSNWQEEWAAAAKLAEAQARNGGNEDIQSIENLLTLSENRSDASSFERRARARSVTKATFQLLRRLTPYDEADEEAGDAAKVPLPGEGVVVVNAARGRLRLLERHEAARCVEYRLFAECLAACDALEELAGAPATLEEEAAISNFTGFVSQWARTTLGKETWQEIVDAEEDAEVRAERGPAPDPSPDQPPTVPRPSSDSSSELAQCFPVKASL